PDGKGILWSSNRATSAATRNTSQVTPFNIYLATAQGTQPRRVTNEQYDAQNATMTRDGQWIVYSSSDPARPAIKKIHPDGTGATVLAAGQFFIPEVSPDGQYALYVFNATTTSNEIRVVRIADGGAVPFTIRCPIYKQIGFTGRARWMPDGKSIVFLAQDENGENGIYSQAFVPSQDTASTKRLLYTPDPDAAILTFGISPDGKRITSSNWEQVGSLILADHVPLGIQGQIGGSSTPGSRR